MDRVTCISIARLVLVIEGQWNEDMSWTYNALLAVEVSEVGATLISLSIPGIKPMWDKYIRRRGHDASSGGRSGHSTKGGGTKGTSITLNNLSLRPQHHLNKLGSTSDCTYNDTKSRHRDKDDDDDGTASTEGIMVRVDFDMTTESETNSQYRRSKAVEAQVV